MSAPHPRISPEDAYRLWAPTYDATENPLLALEERYLLPQLDCVRGATVVDVGCGTGRWLKRMAQLGASSLTGVDSSSDMLAIAQMHRLRNTDLHQTDAVHLPSATESVDIVIASFLVSYLGSLSLFLQEMFRVLRPGGVLFLTDLHPEGRRRGWASTFRHENEVYVIDTVPYTLDNLRREASLARFYPQFCLEPCFGEPERQFFLRAQRSDLFEASAAKPAIYIAAMKKGHDGLLRNDSHAV